MAPGGSTSHPDQCGPNSQTLIWPKVANQTQVIHMALNCNSNSGCSRAKGPDMPAEAALAWMTPWSQVTAQATQIKMSLVAAWPSDSLS